MNPISRVWQSASSMLFRHRKGLLAGVFTLLFGAVGAWAQPATISVDSGDGQSAQIHTAFTNPLVILVKDGDGAAVNGAVVTFSGPGLAFSATAGTVVTGADGKASVVALAKTTGPLTATADAGNGITVTFSLTGTKAGGPNTRYVYWATNNHVPTSTGQISRSDITTGLNVQSTWIHDTNDDPWGVAVDANFIYWADKANGYIGRSTLDGSSINDSMWIDCGRTAHPRGVKVDNGHVYWADYDLETIGRADIDGGNVVNNWITGALFATGVAVDDTYVYWAESGPSFIGRALKTDPTTAVHNWIDVSALTATPRVWDVAVDATHIYWADQQQGYIGRADLNGAGAATNKTPAWVNVADSINYLALGDQIYYTTPTALGQVSIAGGTPSTFSTPIGNTFWGIGVSPATVTVVTMASFTAQPKAGGVTLAWTTGSEIDTAGFNALRSEGVNGPYTKVNGALIAAKGTGMAGASYTFVDTDVAAGQTWFYQLEDIDTAGTATFHGPVSATLVASPIAAFQASPADVFAGGGTTLTWAVSGTPALTLTGFGAVTGTSQWVVPGSTTAYTLADDQGHQNMVTVNVKAFGLKDMSGLSLAWGSVKGNANYNPCYDLNGDGKVDDADVALCFKGL